MNSILKRVLDLSNFNTSNSTYAVPQELVKLAAHAYANYLLYNEEEGIMFDEDDPHQNPLIVSDKALRLDNDDACLFLNFINNALYDRCADEDLKTSDFIAKYISGEITYVYGLKAVVEDGRVASYEPVLDILGGFDNALFQISDNEFNGNEVIDTSSSINSTAKGILDDNLKVEDDTITDADDLIVKDAIQKDIVEIEMSIDASTTKDISEGPIIAEDLAFGVDDNVIVNALHNLKYGVVPEYNSWENRDTFNWYADTGRDGSITLRVYSGTLLRHLVCSKALEFMKEKGYDDTMLLLESTTLSIMDKLFFDTFSKNVIKVLPLSFKKVLEADTGKKYNELYKLFYESEVDVPIKITGDRLDFVLTRK